LPFQEVPLNALAQGRHQRQNSASSFTTRIDQELMRHASSRCTLEVYSQARILAKRQAQQRVVQMILSEEADTPVPTIQYGTSELDTW
jgi:hypothetical protein